MPQTMSSPPISSVTMPQVAMPLDTSAVLRAARSRRGLVLGLGILVLALGAAWFASAQLQPIAESAPDKMTKTRPALDRATLAKLDLSTFQRRGALLVGEITTPAGVRLRLVMDANTRELVGLRVVETEAGTTP